MLTIKNIEWIGDADSGWLRLLDQTRLPGETVYLDCRDVEQVWQAIKRLAVRGAPAIGVAAAYACVLGVQRQAHAQAALALAAEHLATSRPTAVNLFWALRRMRQVSTCTPARLLDEARKIHEEDAAMCRQIGEHALPLLKQAMVKAAGPDGDAPGVLTHCNAGALATGGIGTATAPMYLAAEAGLAFKVYADETRPLLQGARLTAYELLAAGVDVTLICDDMAAQVMREGRVRMVITGADRIAANGDAANKIGTYSLAVLARHHGLPFYVAAPSSTFDLSIPDGSHIPIELRGPQEIISGFGRATAPAGVKTYSPAFDVTPHELITAIITERGLIQPVSSESVATMLA
jgi:methylthioribose-1-phosphate isomerase